VFSAAVPTKLSLPEYGGHQFHDFRFFGFINGKIDATTILGTEL